MRNIILIAAVLAAVVGFTQLGSAFAGTDTITFASQDGLNITADLYLPHAAPDTPLILLCHQANWSRGEYREIAPRLNALGFNCIAIDQRSGGRTQGVSNKTAQAAEKSGRDTAYVDAEQDMLAALAYARAQHAQGHVLLWGSSYSAALALRIAGEHPDLVDGVLAFAPGEYFESQGKSDRWITRSAAKIRVPAFVTSARNEATQWAGIYAAIRSDGKTSFLPQTRGKHGSSALWTSQKDSHAYWAAVEAFLQPFQPETTTP